MDSSSRSIHLRQYQNVATPTGNFYHQPQLQYNQYTNSSNSYQQQATNSNQCYNRQPPVVRYRAPLQNTLPVILEDKQYYNQQTVLPPRPQPPQQQYQLPPRQTTTSYQYPPSPASPSVQLPAVQPVQPVAVPQLPPPVRPQIQRPLLPQEYQIPQVSVNQSRPYSYYNNSLPSNTPVTTMQSQQPYSSSPNPYIYQNQPLHYQSSYTNQSSSLPQHVISDVNLNQHVQKNFENYPQGVPPSIQQGGYPVQQSSPQPQSNTYYPYHQQILNASIPSNQQSYVNDQQYSVKLPTGVIHQYPTPDYSSPPSDSKQHSNAPQGLYHPPVGGNVYEQSHQGEIPAASYVSPSNSASNSPYTPSPLAHMVNKQDAEYSPQNTSLSPSYVHYRTNVTDSPLGSPLNNQVAPAQGVFKTPQATPPLQRREPPVRQISNEIYKLDSPSSQLLLQDMSLNSPRPRSETVDMDQPPVLPPRSPVPTRKENTDEPPVLNRAQTPTIQQTTQPDLLIPQNQRLRSGTVEMVEANVATTNQVSDSKLMPPPSAQLTMQLGLTGQRNRAGTIEMVDSSQTYGNDYIPHPEQRIRSGTVEMSDAPQNIPSQAVQTQPTNYQNQPVVTYDQQQKIQNNYTNQSPQQTATYASYPSPTTQVRSTAAQPQQQILTTQQHTQHIDPNLYPVRNQNNINRHGTNIKSETVQQTPIINNTNNKEIVGSISTNSPSIVKVLQQNQKHQKPPPPYIPPQNISNNTANQIVTKDTQYKQIIPNTNVNQQPQTHTTQPVTQTQKLSQQLPVQSQQPTTLPQDIVPQVRQQNSQNVPQQNYVSDINTQNNVQNNTKSMQRTTALNEEIPADVIDAYVQVYNTSSSVNNKPNQVSKPALPPNQPPPQQGYTHTPPPQNVVSPASVYNEAELDRQQKLMQQQYVQRVRQAQLQQQLRQIQNEYEATLQIEQDVAREFLLEQEIKKEHPNTKPGISQQQPQYVQNLPANYQQKSLTHPIPNPMGQHPRHQNMQQYHTIPGGHPMPPMGYQPPPQALPQQPLPQQTIPQPRYMHPQAPRNNLQSQPILIMPGGGGFSSTGQFAPQNNLPPYQSQQPLKNNSKQTTLPNTSRGGGGKEQTPFQKLRKIAEDISSFVDDVVKFKGKKGDQEYRYLDEMLTQQLLALDKIASIGTDELRNARKALVKEIQELLEILERRATNQKES